MEAALTLAHCVAPSCSPTSSTGACWRCSASRSWRTGWAAAGRRCLARSTSCCGSRSSPFAKARGPRCVHSHLSSAAARCHHDDCRLSSVNISRHCVPAVTIVKLSTSVSPLPNRQCWHIVLEACPLLRSWTGAGHRDRRGAGDDVVRLQLRAGPHHQLRRGAQPQRGRPLSGPGAALGRWGCHH